jgi:membrane dipeptidase
MLIIDGHLDLASSAIGKNRDLTLNVSEIRKSEADNIHRRGGWGTNTVSLYEMRRGNVAVCLATCNPLRGYASLDIAHATARGNLAYYQFLESRDQIRIIKDWDALNRHFEEWRQKKNEEKPIGVILTMEGSDGIVKPNMLKTWYDNGLRIFSLVHYGKNIFAHGTGTTGGLTKLGKDLLEEMHSIGAILDVSHLSEDSFWEALDLFSGPTIATHNNCKALVPGDRQLSDRQIKTLVQREAVIGIGLDAWMLYPGWIKGETSNTVVSLEAVTDHMDHVCKLAHNSSNVAIGSDLDGGFGTEQSPFDLDTIADLQKIPKLLLKKNYNENDVNKIMYRNWLQFFKNVWDVN